MRVITNWSTTLSASVTSSQTTIPLSSIQTSDASPHTITISDLDATNYGVLEPGGAKMEIFSFTGITDNGDGSGILTGVTRGLAFYGATGTAVTANEYAHQAGSQFVLSNAHYYYDQLMDLDSAETVTGVKTFSVSPIVPTGGSGTQAANSADIANAITGFTGLATTTVYGTVKMSTAPASPTAPIAVGDNDTRLPSSGQASALVGTSGTPGSVNLYVTNNDTSNGTDQSQTTQNGTTKAGEADATGKQNKLAQSIVASQILTTGATLYKSADTGSFTGTVTVSLQADTAGSPSGSALATVTLSNAIYLALPVGAFSVVFGTAYATVVGTTYWIVIATSTSDNSNHPNLGTNTAGGYGSGSVKYNNTTDGWVAIATIDLYFASLTGNASKVLRTDANGFAPVFTPGATDSGSTDAYKINFAGVTAYATHQVFSFKAATANTGAATLDVNSLGPKNIYRYSNGVLGALNTGDILAGQEVTVAYDGTQFQMQSQLAKPLVYASSTASRTANASPGAVTYAHGLGRKPNFIRITALNSTANSIGGVSVGTYDGTTNCCTYSAIVNTGSAQSGTTASYIVQSYVGTAGEGTHASATFDATNVTLTWAADGSPGAVGIQMLIEAQ